VNAEPLLNKIAEVFSKHNFEAIMIGNSAAALLGAPVTTLDIDFMFRETEQNKKKLIAIAKDFDAELKQPFQPTSDMYRITNMSAGIQLDFISRAHGISSFASLRSRAKKVTFGNCEIYVAGLSDIINSKKSAGRPQDLAVLHILEALKEELKEDS
jgi:hypothetical protein